MARKSEEMKRQLWETAARLQEVNQLVAEAETEEKALLEKAEQRVRDIEKDGYFIGAILHKQDLLAILDLALTSKEDVVRVPARVYFSE